MVKYVIANTGEPVNIGDVIRKEKKVKTSFGTMKTVKELLVTKDIIPELIKEGILKQQNVKTNEETANIGYYVKKLSDKYGKSIEDITAWLEDTNKICPKAVLDILLNEIAVRFYNDNPEAFNKAEEYYSLRPKDGKVGKVHSINPYLPIFKSIEDAEKARTILKEQLKLMYGE